MTTESNGKKRTGATDPQNGSHDDPAGGSEGWESLARDDAGSKLDMDPELAAALAEAAESMEARTEPSDPSADATSQPAGGESSAAEVSQLKDQLLRLQADFENFRRRSLKEREEAFQYGHENLVKELLPTVDNLERAIESARGSGSGDLQGLLQGVELVLRELRGVFEKHGVAEVEADGKPFDPSVHEAMAQLPDGSVAPGTVVQVYEKGYRLRDRLLRPSRVVVSRAPAPGEGAESGDPAKP